MLEDMRTHSSTKYKHEYKAMCGNTGFYGKGIMCHSLDNNKQSDDKPKHKNQWDDRVKSI
jgi:hypothetical protein